MGRSPCCSSKGGRSREAWSTEEDRILSEYIRIHGEGRWTKLSQNTGLKRCGKSCRLRWLNHLRPDIKRGDISLDEDDLIIRMHNLLGNRWSLIAGRLPGRTDSEIKNYWNSHLRMRNLAMKESQRNKQIVKTGSTFPSRLQNKVFKPTPVKITTVARHYEVVRPNGCNRYGGNHSSDETAFRLSDVKETTNPSKSEWCDLLVENSLTGDESERIALAMADVNLVGTEVKNSICSHSSLPDQQSPHSNHFPAITSAQSLLDCNELPSPCCNLFLSPSNYSLTDFGIKEIYTGQVSLALETTEFEYFYFDQSNIRFAVSYFPDD